jgi:hypothetical protein
MLVLTVMVTVMAKMAVTVTIQISAMEEDVEETLLHTTPTSQLLHLIMVMKAQLHHRIGQRRNPKYRLLLPLVKATWRNLAP